MRASVPRLAVLADRLVLERPALPAVAVPLSEPMAAPAWTPALESLLHAAGGVAGAEVTVQASHARLFLLQHHDALCTESHWAGYAHSRFEALMGGSAGLWTIRVVPERPPRPRLAVAVPAALLQALTATLGAGLRALRVDTLARLDALCASEPRFTGAAVECGERHLVVSFFERGVLQRLRQRRSAVAVGELGSLLRVEWAALGHDGALPALALGPGLPADADWSPLAQRTLALA